MRSGKSWLRIVSVMLAVGVLLLAGGMIALRVILSPERLRAETIRRTSAATGLDVELESASLSFLPFGVEIRGLQLAAPATDRPPLLNLRSGLLRLDLRALLSRSVVIEQVLLDGPVVSVAQEDLEKQAEQPETAAKGGARPQGNAASRGAAVIAGSFRGAIEHLEITDGAWHLRTAGGAGDVTLGGIHLRARVEATPGGGEVRAVGELELDRLEVAALAPYREALDALQPATRFELVLRTAENRVEVRALELVPKNTAIGIVRVRGTLEDVNRPGAARFDLQANAEIDLGTLSKAGLAPDGTEVGGRVRADVTGSGTFAAPEEADLSGEVTLDELTARSDALPVPISEGSARAKLRDGNVELESVAVRAGRSRFEGSGRVARALAEPHVTLEGRCARLDLTEWMPDPDDGGGAGTGRGCAARARGGAGPDAPLLPPLPPVDADLRLDVDSLVTADAALAGATMTIALRNGVAKVEASAREGRFGKGVRMTDLAANVDVQGQTMRGTFRSPLVQAHRVPLTDVKGRIDLAEDRQLRIQDATASVWTGRVEGTAVVDLTDAASPAFTIESRGVNLQANDFVSGLTPARDFLFGQLDIRSSFTGKGSTPNAIAASLTGSGQVSAREGRLNRGAQTKAIWSALQLGERESIPFRDLVTAFRVEGGRVVTDDLVLGGSDANWKASGSVAFAGALDYTVEVELSEDLSGRFRQRMGSDLTKLLSGSTGRIALPLEIGGTVQRPRVTLDRDELAKRAAKALQGELTKQKDKLGDALRDLLGGKKK